MKIAIAAFLIAAAWPYQVAAQDQDIGCDAADMQIATTPALPVDAESLRRFRLYLKREPSTVNEAVIGDSIAELWSRPFQQSRNILDLGIAGDRIQQVVWRLQQPEIRQFSPKRVIVIAGTNNLALDKTCGIVAAYVTLIHQIRSLWPAATITAVGILPRGASFQEFSERRAAVNAELKIMSTKERFDFIDLDDAISCHWTTPCGNYRHDNLHMTDSGNAILSSQLLK